MKNSSLDIEIISQKYKQLQAVLNERAIRLWCATEAQSLGHGGISKVHRATGISRKTIHKGIAELNSEKLLDQKRVRHQGGGRKKITQTSPGLLKDLDDLVKPPTRDAP